MVATVGFQRVTGLPNVCVPNTLYFVQASAGANIQLYATGNDTTPYLVGNPAITLPLPVASGGTGDTGTAWTVYTPTVVAATGVLATATAYGRYKRIGKTVFLRVNIIITANGTAAGYLTVSLPFAAPMAGNNLYQQVITGKEVAMIGFGLGGNIGDGVASMNVTRSSDGSYPGGNNYALTLSGVYEAQ